VLSAAEARKYPEFGAHGPLHFFAPGIEYFRQNRSGFDLHASGSILLLAALALLLARRDNLRLLRAEVLALPVVVLGAYALAQAVLFKLYLPHRYTYPLVAFFAIAVGVTIRPTWDALWAPPRPCLQAFALLVAPLPIAAFAAYVFPLGPAKPLERPWTTVAIVAGAFALAAAVVALLLRRAPGRSAPAAGAVLTGMTLLGFVLQSPDSLSRGSPCPTGPAIDYLGKLPKDAVIAGDPNDMKCLPATARRAVVISTQLAPAYDGQFVRRLLRSGEPAVLHLPASCLRWKRGANEVYDIRCIRAAVGNAPIRASTLHSAIARELMRDGSL
jgi:hypothetical protein